MNELKIVALCDGTCAECDRKRAGVRFRLMPGLIAESQFLCWEHFRLLQEAMKPQRVVIEETHVINGHSCCCHHACCCHRGRTFVRGYTVGSSRSQSIGMSQSHTEGISESDTMGHTWSSSEGESHS